MSTAETCCWFADDMDFRPLAEQVAEFQALARSEKCRDCPGAPQETEGGDDAG